MNGLLVLGDCLNVIFQFRIIPVFNGLIDIKAVFGAKGFCIKQAIEHPPPNLGIGNIFVLELGIFVGHSITSFFKKFFIVHSIFTDLNNVVA